MGDEYQNALKILETPLPDKFNISFEPKSTVFTYLSLKAGLRALQGDQTKLKQIQSQEFGDVPCAEWIVTSTLSQALSKSDKNQINLNNNQKNQLGEILLSSYKNLEKKGLHSFAFYNQWGIFEHNQKNYQAAYKIYAKALKYEGDKEWVLLNWGNAALANGEYQLAREMYLQSLSFGTVPNAVRGLLSTLWQQGDKKVFLQYFEKYSESLSVFSQSDRSDFERGAIIFSCELGVKLTKTLLFHDESIILEGKSIPRIEFQKMVCN